MGGFSNINASVPKDLSGNFSDICIDVIDMSEMISKRDMAALYYCVREYGLHTLIGRKKLYKLF